MKIALDTNVLVYAEGANGTEMRDAALNLIQHLPQEEIVLPVQVLGELFRVLVKKAKRRPKLAREAVLAWHDAYPLAGTSSSVMFNAMDLSIDHNLGIWDAVILSAAADAGCRLLLSEDLQSGFTWRGVTVANPFAPSLHPVLKGLLLSS